MRWRARGYAAGAPGYRVLLLDRDAFPSEVPRGNFIHRQGPRLLHRWGLLNRVVESNCPSVRTAISDFGDFRLVARDLEVDGVAFGYGPRRKALDKILVDAAVEAGAEFRDRFPVDDFLSDGDRITGIRGRDARSGGIVAEQARITIGADGRNSALARAVHALAYEQTRPLNCYYFSFWSGVPAGAFEMCIRRGCAIFTFPSGDGLFAVFIGWPIHEFDSVRSATQTRFLQALDLSPDLAGRVRGGYQEERFYGAADLPNFLRKPFGPGWALVGDAGCHKDPFLALGICDAFRDAELLAAAVDEGLSGKRPMEEALADYETRRNRATMDVYRENVEMARLGPPPAELLQLRAGCAGARKIPTALCWPGPA